MTDSNRGNSYQPRYCPPGYSAHGYSTNGSATDGGGDYGRQYQGTHSDHSSMRGSAYYPDDVVRDCRADPNTHGSSGAASAYRDVVHGPRPPDDSRPTTAASQNPYHEWTRKPVTDLSDEPENRPPLPPRPSASSTNPSTQPVMKRKKSRSGLKAIVKGLGKVVGAVLDSA